MFGEEGVRCDSTRCVRSRAWLLVLWSVVYVFKVVEVFVYGFESSVLHVVWIESFGVSGGLVWSVSRDSKAFLDSVFAILNYNVVALKS